MPSPTEELSKFLIKDFYKRSEKRSETVKKSLKDARRSTLILLTVLVVNLLTRYSLGWTLTISVVSIWLLCRTTIAYSIRRIKIWATVQRHFGVKDFRKKPL